MTTMCPAAGSRVAFYRFLPVTQNYRASLSLINPIYFDDLIFYSFMTYELSKFYDGLAQLLCVY